MYYIVQENVFNEISYDNLIIALERLDLPYEIIKVKPFIETIEFETNRTDIFPFGCLKLARVSKRYNWQPGSLMNINNDFMVYKDYYKEHLLNYDSEIVKFGDEFVRDNLFFARPTEDTKTFTGKVFDMDNWKEFRNDALTNGHSTILSKETPIQLSSVKTIHQEIRFWIVGGKIITASLYKLGNVVCYSETAVNNDAFTFCEQMIDKFQLADAFVMDICMTDNGYKIVECGCINCAGFYRANMQKLIIALENYF